MIYLFLISFHPEGEPEASICCVIKGEASFTIASPLSALHMKASDSCKIQVLTKGFDESSPRIKLFLESHLCTSKPMRRCRPHRWLCPQKPHAS